MRHIPTLRGAVLSELINCGTYKAQPVFVIRHFQHMNAAYGLLYIYSVHTCRYCHRSLFPRVSALCPRLQTSNRGSAMFLEL